MNKILQPLAIALAITFALTTQTYAQHRGGHHSAPRMHGLSRHGHGGFGHKSFGHGSHGHQNRHGFRGRHSTGHFGAFWRSPFRYRGYDGHRYGHHNGYGYGSHHSPRYFGNLSHNPLHHGGHGRHSDPYGNGHGGHSRGHHSTHGLGHGFLSFLPGLFDLGRHNLGSDRYSDPPYYRPRVYAPDRSYPYTSTRSSRLSYTDLMKAGSDYFKNGDYRRASQSFLEAVLLRPDDPVPKFSLGHTLFALGDYDQSAHAIRRGLSIFPNWVRIRMNRRDFYTYPGDFDSQLAALKHWSEQHPNNVSAKFLLGYNYYFSSQKEKAHYAFSAVLSLDPNDRYAKYFLDEM